VEKPVKRKKPPYSIKDKFLKKCYMEALAQIAKEHYKKEMDGYIFDAEQYKRMFFKARNGELPRRNGMISLDKVLEVFDEEEKLIPIRWRCGRAITTLRKALEQLK